jgi:hypothetical protein
MLVYMWFQHRPAQSDGATTVTVLGTEKSDVNGPVSDDGFKREKETLNEACKVYDRKGQSIGHQDGPLASTDAERLCCVTFKNPPDDLMNGGLLVQTTVNQSKVVLPASLPVAPGAASAIPLIRCPQSVSLIHDVTPKAHRPIHTSKAAAGA